MVTRGTCREVLDELRRTTRQHRQLQRKLDMGHLSDVAVLATVAAAGALRLSDLADHLLVDVSVTSRQTTALVGAGLLSREIDPADGRSKLLHLTDAGRGTLQHWRVVGDGLLADRLHDWDEDDARALAHLLRRFNDALLPSCGETELLTRTIPADTTPADHVNWSTR